MIVLPTHSCVGQNGEIGTTIQIQHIAPPWCLLLLIASFPGWQALPAKKGASTFYHVRDIKGRHDLSAHGPAWNPAHIVRSPMLQQP